MYCAYDILVLAVVNGSVRQAVRQSVITTPIIRSEQTNFVRNNFADELACGSTSYALQYSRNDIAFALRSANDWCFLIVIAFLFIPMPIFIFAADIGFIHFNNPTKLLLRLHHRGADFVAHAMRRLVRAKTHLTLNLKRADALLARGHQVHNLEPLPQWFVSVLKNRARYMREAIALIFGARIALPLERHRANREHFGVFAARATDAVRPASRNQIPPTGIFIASRKHGLKLGFRHLVDWLGALGCHGGDSVSTVTIVPFSVPVKPRIIAEIAVVTQSVTKSQEKSDLRPQAKTALPFQTVETVNESAQDRQKGFQFGSGFREEAWRNRLIWGDKKYVLPSLLPEFAGRVNLIYIDPPFDTGADFSFTAKVPDDPNSEDESFTFTKEPSIIEQKAYRDTWGGARTHLGAYLKWFYETALLLHELLHETGSIYVHIGPNVSHYVRAILDEIFGTENNLNEIIWRRAFGHSDLGRYGAIHDTILYYRKGTDATWHDLRQPADKDYIDTFFDQYDEARGDRYQRLSLSAGGLSGGGYDYEYKGVRTLWRCPIETLRKYDAENRLHWPKKKGGVPRLKKYESEHEGVPLQDLWTDISKIHNQSQELVGYPTQKPEALLDRIIRVSSNERDLVFDCFCGSGTTAAVSEKLGRRWIACDLGRFAVHTTRKRLLSISDVRPFIVQNLGKYERQVWAGSEFGDNQAAERQRAYIQFILKLAQATPLNGYTWLHGVKGGRMMHVGAVDAPVSVGDVTQIAAEFKRAVGTGKDAPKTNGVDVLGWDFAFELNEVMKQQAATANIQIRFQRIPRDVMDKRAIEQGDIKFFELAALSVDVKTNRRYVFLKLTDFVIPPDDVPEDVRKAVKHWSQWIDYWAVDWDNKSDTFHNEWQTYRTRKDKSLQLEITHAYADAGDYTIVVKVIDILGNDTTKTVKVKVT